MAERNKARERLLGIILVVGSATVFAFVDGFSKMLAETNSVAQIVWARYVLALPILLLTTRPAELSGLFRTNYPLLQILRGLAPLMVSVAMVLAVRYLPLADATVILFAAPFLVVALSAPLLGEHVRAPIWIAVAVGFAAVIIVAKPGFGELSRFAVFPLIGAVFLAALQLLTRQIAATGERAETILAWTLLTGIVVSTPFVVLFWEPFDFRGWLLMVGVGGTFGVGQLMMIRGFALAPASLLTPLTYAQIVSATLFSMVVFHDTPDLWTVLGILMIIGSGLHLVRRRNE